MALIVEDGTGLANAESYISVADATTYHEARGNATWAALASDTVREQLLRQATDYMVQTYRLRWAGVRGSTTQALDFPRDFMPRPDSYAIGYTIVGPDYFPSDTVPEEVRRACAELALRASEGALLADQEVPVTSEKVGQIAVEYASGAAQGVRYAAIDAMLRPFLKASGLFLPVTRV